MKVRTLWFTVALLVLGATAHAGTKHSLGLMAGMAMPTGDLADAVGTGYVVGGLYEYRIDPRFGVGGVVDYFSLGEKSTSSLVLGSTRTVKWSAPGGMAMVFGRYYLPMKDAPLAPYVTVALEKVRIGFKSTITYRGTSATNEDKQDKVAFGIGVGATRKLNDQVTGGAEVAFHQIATDPDASQMVTLALHCTFALGQ